MLWSWSKQPFGWSYNAATVLPNTGAALFAGGDFQNGTTTDFAVVIEANSVVVRQHRHYFGGTLFTLSLALRHPKRAVQHGLLPIGC